MPEEPYQISGSIPIGRMRRMPGPRKVTPKATLLSEQVRSSDDDPRCAACTKSEDKKPGLSGPLP